jgi:hypothetical protein
LQNERNLPGEELKGTRLSAPATTLKPLSSTARTEKRGAGELPAVRTMAVREDQILPVLSYFTFPQ